MKCQILFSGKNKKTILSLLSAEIADNKTFCDDMCSVTLVF